jgi:hypothetical protein
MRPFVVHVRAWISRRRHLFLAQSVTPRFMVVAVYACTNPSAHGLQMLNGLARHAADNESAP